MKKQLVVLVTILIFLTTFLFYPYATKGQDLLYLINKESIDLSVDEITELHKLILNTDPGTISEDIFYKCEDRIIADYSGSAGFFLDTDQINWILKAEEIFSKKGVELKNKERRHGVIADSYFNHGHYEKALEEFKMINDQCKIEEAEWVINNGMIKKGVVKIKEYEGLPPCGSSKLAKAESNRYVFVSYFKGSVYRFDKLNNTHALIYRPETSYDWCEELELEGEKLFIGLRGDAGIFVFNNETNELIQHDGNTIGTNIEKVYRLP